MKSIIKFILITIILSSCGVSYNVLVDRGIGEWDFTLPSKAVYSTKLASLHDIYYVEINPVVNNNNCRALLYEYEVDTNEVYSFGLIEDYLSVDKKHVHFTVTYHLKDGSSFELYKAMIDLKKLVYYPEYTDIYMYGY